MKKAASEEAGTVKVSSTSFIKPTKRPSKKAITTPAAEPKITDLPRDEQEWFKALIRDTEKEATTSSYFPEVATAPPPDTEVYPDDDIIDDFNEGSGDEYDKYVLEE